MHKFKDYLSPRSKNGISRCFGPQILDTPKVIAQAGSAGLKMTNQLGPRSINEIAELLYEFGYIKSPYEWNIDQSN